VKTKILLMLIAGIGDVVLGSRCIRGIRRAYPDGELHLLTSTDAAPLASNYDFLDRVWSFPIREMKRDKSHWPGVLNLLRSLRREKYAVLANLYPTSRAAGSLKMGILMRLIGAGSRIGFHDELSRLFLTRGAPFRGFNGRHVADYMMDVALVCGAVIGDDPIEVAWDRSCEKKWEDLLFREAATVSRILVGLNPGGDRENRRWDPASFAHLADRLMEDFGAGVLITGGPGDSPLAASIVSRMRHRPVNLTGRLDLNDLAFISSRLDLFVTNDSGPMHIAAAAGTPVVALYGPEDPDLTRPYTSPDLYRILYADLPCRPCRKDRCDDVACLRLLSADRVYEACAAFLHRRRTGSAARIEKQIPRGPCLSCAESAER
jgi:heptosyltransferase I